MKIENLRNLEEVVTAITYGKHEGNVLIGEHTYTPDKPVKMDKGETVVRLVNINKKENEIIARHSRKLKGIKTLNLNNGIFSVSLVKNTKQPVMWKRRINGVPNSDTVELSSKFNIIIDNLA